MESLIEKFGSLTEIYIIYKQIYMYGINLVYFIRENLKITFDFCIRLLKRIILVANIFIRGL